MKMLHLVIICIGLSLTGHAATYQFQPDQGTVSFVAKGKPTFFSIIGEAKGLSGELKQQNGLVSGEISFELKKLQTGIALRDDHMKQKYLEVDTYPIATLKIEQLALPSLDHRFAFEGVLTLHGVSLRVRGEAILNDSGKLKRLSAEFPLKLSQFNIETPSFKGLTVAEDVQVKVDTPVTPNES